ncbi:ribosomal large subunit pseudouridine synthase D (fragment) [Mycoplasma haemofelis str. Langford 1]|uniref:RNA pseudouridylate synthase n=2 Tax=Mycoplasma haemofelis TaxID=29501 RepID=F6FHP2_MYCHI
MSSYSIIFENKNFLIVNKASGIAVHKNIYDREFNLINEVNKDQKANYSLVHRIDKYTSGAVLIAKNKETLLLLQNLFLNNEVEKHYLALTSKELPAKKLKITLSLGRSKNDKLRFTNRNAKNYKPACTEVEVIDRYFLKILLKTGRTHQIRAHLFSINCPVLNDPIYGNRCFNPEFGQYLHAYKLEFTCPITNEFISVTAPLPQEFKDKLSELNIEYTE